MTQEIIAPNKIVFSHEYVAKHKKTTHEEIEVTDEEGKTSTVKKKKTKTIKDDIQLDQLNLLDLH